jgi:hypothetical protein
MFKGHMSFF